MRNMGTFQTTLQHMQRSRGRATVRGHGAVTWGISNSRAAVLSYALGALMLIFCFTRQSAGQDSLRVEYYQVNASQFPTIVSWVRVWGMDSVTVGHLDENNFSVREDGVTEAPIKVEMFGGDSGGVTVVLAMDRSNSMTKGLDDAKNAASTYVRLMNEFDRTALVTFGEDARLDHDFSNNKASLTAAINGITLEPYTALYDGVLFSLDLLENVQGHKALILLTDGRDRDSKANLDAVVARASLANIPIFGIGLSLKPDWGEPELRQIVEASGGIYFPSPTSKDLEEIYRKISFILHRYYYRITYTTHNRTMDGTWRTVHIESRHQGLSGIGVNRYQAPEHIVTLAPASDAFPFPGRELPLRLEIPSWSKELIRLSELTVTLKYNARYLTPIEQRTTAGALFGNAADFKFTFSIDTTAGEIRFHFRRKDGAGPIGGRGVLAEVRFDARRTMPDSTALNFELTDLQPLDETGWPVAMQVVDLTLYSAGLIVWPGDTNHNGIVELTDVLVLGVHWELSGPPRSGYADLLAWQPQLAMRFSTVDATHADADGSGQITERDLIPIGLNWAKKVDESMRPKSMHIAESPQGAISAGIEPVAEPQEYLLKLIFVSLNHAPLAGIVFRMNYPAERVRIHGAQPGSIWPETPLSLVQLQPEANRLAVGIMMAANAPSPTGDGELIEIGMTAQEMPEPGDFSFEDVALVSQDGEFIETQIATRDAAQTAGSNGAFKLYPAYPNPAGPQTRLAYVLPEPANVRVAVFDLLGRTVRELVVGAKRAGMHELTWDGLDAHGNAVAIGTYLVKLWAQTGNGKVEIAKSKIILVK